MRVLHKIYAALDGADPSLIASLRDSLAQAKAVGYAPEADPEQTIWLEGTTVRISFEGGIFPLEELLAILVESQLTGRLDAIDLEAWTLTRHEWGVQGVTIRSADLNQALEASCGR